MLKYEFGIWEFVVCINLKKYDSRHVGLNGPHAHDTLSLVNKMLSTPWFTAVNKCLVDTVDLDDLDEDEEFGIRAVEELMTDFLQLCHSTVRNILPQDQVDKAAASGGRGRGAWAWAWARGRGGKPCCC